MGRNEARRLSRKKQHMFQTKQWKAKWGGGVITNFKNRTEDSFYEKFTQKWHILTLKRTDLPDRVSKGWEGGGAQSSVFFIQSVNRKIWLRHLQVFEQGFPRERIGTTIPTSDEKSRFGCFLDQNFSHFSSSLRSKIILCSKSASQVTRHNKLPTSSCRGLRPFWISSEMESISEHFS